MVRRLIAALRTRAGGYPLPKRIPIRRSANVAARPTDSPSSDPFKPDTISLRTRTYSDRSGPRDVACGSEGGGSAVGSQPLAMNVRDGGRGESETRPLDRRSWLPGAAARRAGGRGAATAQSASARPRSLELGW